MYIYSNNKKILLGNINNTSSKIGGEAENIINSKVSLELDVFLKNNQKKLKPLILKMTLERIKEVSYSLKLESNGKIKFFDFMGIIISLGECKTIAE